MNARKIVFFKAPHHYVAIDIATRNGRGDLSTFQAAIAAEHATASSVSRLSELNEVAHSRRISAAAIRGSLLGCKVPEGALDRVAVYRLIAALNEAV